MISKSDKKNLIVIAAIFGGLVLLYLFSSAYTENVGKIITEYALNYTQIESVEVDGFAVRDEVRDSKKKNSAILEKDSSKYYVHLVEDSANVSKSDTIAFSFSSSASAEAYIESENIKDKINELKGLKSQGQLSHFNVVGLNSLIYTSVDSYAESVLKGNLSEIEKYSKNFVQKMTTKQLATGKKMDFDSQIKEYRNEYNSLKNSIGSYQKVKAPYAGYFVSTVDGLEGAVSYSDVENKKLKPKAGERLQKLNAVEDETAYGKIVGQFTWYFVFDISEKQASLINEGSVVYVNFPNKDIKNIKMTVHDITKAEGSVVTVSLKCKLMNEELIALRKEKAVVILREYSGLKINRNAVVKNEEGLDGVFVLAGNVARFSPIDIKYYGDDYVIADKLWFYKKDKDGKDIVDYEKTDSFRAIKLYDNIIVKGKNIEDGKLIG